MRLGKREKELLWEIEETPGDVLVGFLLSAGSGYRMNKITRKRTIARKKKKEEEWLWRQKRKRVLQQLRKKRLIKLVPYGNEHKVVLNEKEVRKIDIERMSRSVAESKHTRWDRKWTIVMFDVPEVESTKRVRLSHMLQKIGFKQSQLSVYVFPYEVSGLVAFLETHPSYGQYCQVFRGVYQGDDSALRKEFGLQSCS